MRKRNEEKVEIVGQKDREKDGRKLKQMEESYERWKGVEEGRINFQKMAGS